MQNDNNTMQDGLRQMKSDYEHLKADMDRQTIINRQLMETVFRSKVGVLDSNKKTALAGIGAALVLTIAAAVTKGVSIYITGMLAALYIIMLAGYAYIYRKLGTIEYGTGDILSTVTRLRKFKRDYMAVNIVSWILAAGILCLILPAIHGSFRGIPAAAFMCAAVLAGAVGQYFIDRKILRTCDDIIGHLKDRP